MIAELLLLLLNSSAPSNWRPVPPETAHVDLGFSGATLSVRSVDDPKRPGTARRRLTLRLASGATRTFPLHDGGGDAGNNGLNLYHVAQDQFLLVSERDCVVIDPIGVMLATCSKRAACSLLRSYLGRFDWMTGYDPPRGRFQYRFRFLAAYDASESRGC